MDGFFGRILTVDLDRQNYQIEAVDDDIYRRFLGGKGLASYLLYERNEPGVDPLSPDNHLVFATGPIAQSSVWGSCRYGVFTKSPLTGFYAESYSGGRAPEAMDAAGYDAVLVKGRSGRPAVLTIHPDGVDFHEAGDLWGKDTFEAEDAALERFSDARYRKRGAVVIGPAAENLVRFSVIENDYWRSAGRAGVGTVMGSKNLKALVFQGDRKRPIHDADDLKAFSRDIMETGKESPAAKAYKGMGTPMMVKVLNGAGAFPTRYWTSGSCSHWENISAEALHSQCEVRPNACLKCFMACGRMTTVKHGRHEGLRLEGPEYETIYAFGGLCLVDSIEEICHLNDICDRLGMDTITSGNLCAFAIEAVKRGKVSYDIDYGDVDAIADLLRKIAYRDGIGDILAQGIKHAAKTWGLEDIAVHAKGMEPAGYDPRVLKGMGLAYATSDRGACHLRATFYKPELSGMIPPDQIKDKAALFIEFEDRLTVFDALVLCRFYRDMYDWSRLGTMLSAISGHDAEQATLVGCARSISNIVRRFNIREGLTSDDDRLSKGLFKKVHETGRCLTEEEMNYMVADYYRLRGWDEKGIPVE
ncbi:MAG: aldehyde ferredoxin oxidoreductase family protein [Desulfobacterales bacterium]